MGSTPRFHLGISFNAIYLATVFRAGLLFSGHAWLDPARMRLPTK